MSHIFPLVSFKFCNRFIHIYLLRFSVAPEEGQFCLTEILGIKFYIFSRPVSLSIAFVVYFSLLILIFHQDPASLRRCLYKWSLHYSLHEFAKSLVKRSSQVCSPRPKLTHQGQTITKVIRARGRKEPKKINARENDEKIQAKKKLKEKNYAEGSSNCDFY